MKLAFLLLISMAFVATSADPIKGLECKLCTALVSALENYIDDGHTAEDIKAYIDSVCTSNFVSPSHT